MGARPTTTGDAKTVGYDESATDLYFKRQIPAIVLLPKSPEP